MMPEELIPTTSGNPNVINTENENTETELTLDVFENSVIEVKDAQADHTIPPKPPKGGTHPVSIKRNTDKKITIQGREFVGVFPALDKNGKPMVKAHLICNIIDPDGDYNNFQVQAYVGSNVFGGRATSPLHSLMNYLGSPVSNAEKPLELVRKASELFDEEPKGYIHGDWQAQVKYGEDYKLVFYNPKTNKYGLFNKINEGMREGYLPLNTMENFPKDSNGEYNHIVENPIDGTPVYAQFRFIDFVKNPNNGRG
jgi:hypothetical protein